MIRQFHKMAKLTYYSGTPAEEKVFVARLLELAERFRVGADDPYYAIERKRRLPWPGFLEEELKAARHWTDSQSGETQDYLLALTFLPRLFALTDCSLPIVLFSSTGRREILDALRPYGNIFSEFEKPRFFGALTEGFLDDTRRGFAAAIAKAITFLGTRVDLATLVRDPEPAPAPLKGEAFEIELFLDERGQLDDPDFSVGGILVVKSRGAIAGPAKFDQWLQALRTEISKQCQNVKSSDKVKRFLRGNRDIIASQLVDLTKNTSIRIAAVRVSGSRASLYQDPKAISLIEQVAVADNLDRELLRCTFETAVYTLARSMIPATADPIVAKVLAGTRIVPLSEYRRMDPRLSEDEIKRLFLNNWGLRAENVQEKGMSIRHVSYDTPRPLVEQVLHHYRGSRFHPRIDEARADNINNLDAIRGGYIRPLHLFADSVLFPLSPTEEYAKRLFEEGIDCQLDSELSTLLKVQRLALRRLDAHALALARTITPWRSAHRVARLLLSDLRRIALDLSGDDLVGLAALDIELLRDPPVRTNKFPFAPNIVPGGRQQLVPFVGTVIADRRTDNYRKGSIEIHVAELGKTIKFAAQHCLPIPIAKRTYRFFPNGNYPSNHRYQWKLMAP
jgi:hypothetical protein